jgi:hypothetical protein
MTDDTPTQRMPEAAPASAPAAEPARRSRGLQIALLAVGAAILAALIVLIVVLVRPNDPVAAPVASASPTPSASATPSATPSPIAEPEVDAPDAPPAAQPAPEPESEDLSEIIDYFTSNFVDAECPTPDATVYNIFAWRTSGTQVIFAIGTDQAELQPYGTFENTAGVEVPYQCSEDGPDQVYSIAVLGDGVVVDRASITITD